MRNCGSPRQSWALALFALAAASAGVSSPLHASYCGSVTADAGDEITACAGGTATLDGSRSSGNEDRHCVDRSYRWRDGETVVQDWSADPVAEIVPRTAVYELDFVARDDGSGWWLSDSDWVLVIVGPEPVAGARAPDDLVACLDETVVLEGSATRGADCDDARLTFRWYDAAGTLLLEGGDPRLEVVVTGDTTYDFEVLVESPTGTATDRDTVAVSAFPGVVVDAGPDRLALAFEPVGIGTSTPPGCGVPPYTYAWDPAEGLDDPTSPEPIARVGETTTYCLTVSDTSGIEGTDCMQLGISRYGLRLLMAKSDSSTASLHLLGGTGPFKVKRSAWPDLSAPELIADPIWARELSDTPPASTSIWFYHFGYTTLKR